MDINELFRDDKTIQSGEWVTEISGFDVDFALKVRGLTSAEYMAAMARRQRIAPMKDREKDRSIKIDAMRVIFADLLPEYIILDWRGVEQDGKPLPFDKEKMKTWLRQPSAMPLMNAILEAAGRIDDTAGTMKAEAVKN